MCEFLIATRIIIRQNDREYNDDERLNPQEIQGIVKAGDLLINNHPVNPGVWFYQYWCLGIMDNPEVSKVWSPHSSFQCNG